MDVIVTAGGKPSPGQPLYEQTNGGYKALLDVQGKPMIQWVLDAIGEAAGPTRVVVVGLPVYSNLVCSRPLTILPDQGDMLRNLRAGVDEILENSPETRQVLAVSSDIPTITPEMVDWMISRVQESDHDLYYNVIERGLMEKRFPNARRTYLRLKEMEVCGGDLNAVSTAAVKADNPVYDQLIGSRKNPFRQASLLGFDTLVLLMLHRLTLEQAAALASKRLGIRGRAIRCPYAEIGMDVDKPGQLALVREDLARQKVL
ncbi:MAG: nucleotidyltransferase family protein [Chloroflexi bacterium]|nr:nucleotidyltransferase family protein [Chloroflexota bacterium]